MRVRTCCGAVIAAALLAVSGCGPTDPVPGGPSHPATATAPEAPAAPEATEPAADPATESPPAHGGEHGDHGEGGGHGDGAGDEGAGDDGAAGGGGAADAASAPTPEELIAAEIAAYEAARPVFEKYCASCHTPGSRKSKKKALRHFSMKGYPFGGHHAHELSEEIRESLGVGGGKASMPRDDRGAVQGEELALIVAWSEAFDRAAAARAGYHGGGGAHEDGGGHGHGHGH